MRNTTRRSAARRRLRTALLGIGLAWAVATTALTVAAGATPVEARGALLPWAGEVERVSWLGADVYVDLSGGTRDLVTGALLLAAGGLAGLAALRLRGRTEPRTVASLAGIAGFSAFLALDEVLAVHETVGHNLGWLRHLPGITHPDDAILLAYGLVAAALAWDARHLVRGTRLTPRLAAGTAGLAALAVLHDVGVLASEPREELLEIAAAGFGLLTLAALVAEHAARAGALRPAPAARPLASPPAGAQVRGDRRQQRVAPGPHDIAPPVALGIRPPSPGSRRRAGPAAGLKLGSARP